MGYSLTAEELYKEYDSINWNDQIDVLDAVANNGLYLKKASSVLRQDKSIVSKAIENFPLAIKFADESLKDDFEIADAACRGDWWAYKYLSENMQKNSKILDTVFPSFTSEFKISTVYEKKERYDVLKQKFLLSAAQGK